MRQRNLSFCPVVLSLIALFWLAADVHGVEIMKRPLRYIDTSGKEIASYCLVPLFARSHGIGGGAEATGRKTEPERYLRSPRSIREGDGLYDRQPNERAKRVVLFGVMPIVYGSEMYLTKFLVLKKGFLPALSPSYIDVTKVKDIPMLPGDGESAVGQLLSIPPDLQSLRSLFNLQEQVPLVVEYTPADRDLIRNCYYEKDSESH